jgi:hypothetical protein
MLMLLYCVYYAHIKSNNHKHNDTNNNTTNKNAMSTIHYSLLMMI